MIHNDTAKLLRSVMGSQRELARALGVRESTVSRWVTGRTPLPSSIRKLVLLYLAERDKPKAPEDPYVPLTVYGVECPSCRHEWATKNPESVEQCPQCYYPLSVVGDPAP